MGGSLGVSCPRPAPRPASRALSNFTDFFYDYENDATIVLVLSVLLRGQHLVLLQIHAHSQLFEPCHGSPRRFQDVSPRFPAVF